MQLLNVEMNQHDGAANLSSFGFIRDGNTPLL